MSKPYKYERLLDEMKKIINEDECNDTYGSVRMHQALNLKKELFNVNFPNIPSERTVYRIMKENGLIHKVKRKPNGLTKADKEAQKSDNLLKGDFEAEAPNEKLVTDITQLPTADGKLYISSIYDCFNNENIGLAMADNMRKELVIETLWEAAMRHDLRGAITHSDRGSQYTSQEYRECLEQLGIKQSMNSAGGRCHDNAKCESMWARFKEELIYGRYNTAKMKMEEVKTLVWRYFMGYWNNRRISSANGGLPPAEKRKRYYENERAA